MSRRAQLEERLRALLVRCDEQRAELAYRLEQIRPSTQVANWTQRAPAMALNHPLAWLAAVAGIVILLRPRRLLSWLTFATGAMAILSRATALLKLFMTLRSLRSGFR
jgi:YqjK-like protein